MHFTAFESGKDFFLVYGRDGDTVLDIGSMDVNGTLRPTAPPNATYIGCDLSGGPGVDVILDDPYHLPWSQETFDLVVSTSCFEHTEFFWEVFVEMARVVKPSGFVYVSAPVQGDVHRYPVDCWRFYPDAGRALAKWSQRAGFDVELVESFQIPPDGDQWRDFVGVWQKKPFGTQVSRLVHRFPNAQHTCQW